MTSSTFIKKRRFVVVERDPTWNWRIKVGRRYVIVGETELLYFVWANNSQVAILKAGTGKYTIVRQDE